MVDLGPSYVFPSHITFTELRPDIVIYSNSIKRVVLIELTSPCEENMPYWHDYKVQHYANLTRSIRTNGWQCEVLAIEVGARGFCSRTVVSALKRLGFPNKLTNKTVKELGSTSTKSSFFIWLSRNTFEWSPDLSCTQPIFKSNKFVQVFSKNCSLSPVKVAPKKAKVPSKAQTLHVLPKSSKKKDFNRVGFFNKGQTCYANSILQALYVVPEIWSKCSASTSSKCSASTSKESGSISRLTKSFLLNMTIKEKHNRSTPIDPSGFLWALQCQYHSLGHPEFKFNCQYDVVEILRVVLDELSLNSPPGQNIHAIQILTSLFCNSCHCSSDALDFVPILTLPLARSISASIDKFLASESMEGENSVFCHVCGEKRESFKDTSFAECGDVLIIQLERYSFINGNTIKDQRHVNLTPPTLRIPHGTDGEISFVKSYDLKAVINHSGTATSGHYWANVFDKNSGFWLKCDDTSVTKIKLEELNSSNSYLLFYTLKET